jgi:dTDP-L-rhamnose 4-epimerase
VLMQALARHPVARIVCASSMSIYGEGLAENQSGELVAPKERGSDQLRRGDWELQDSDGGPLTPLPTPESKQPSLSSVYALNKYTQERLSLIVGKAYGIPSVALRFFNVYGPRQALSNPYTGVLAIFAARLLNGRPPLVFEDGCQKRDFVHVRDVARANVLALTAPEPVPGAFNVASGTPRTVLDMARALARAFEGAPEPQVTGQWRGGDVRHVFASAELAAERLGFRAQEDFDAGMREFATAPLRA